MYFIYYSRSKETSICKHYLIRKNNLAIRVINNIICSIVLYKLLLCISLYNVIYYKNNKNIFNKNEGRCRDVKTQKACEQGWEVNVGPKIKHTTST